MVGTVVLLFALMQQPQAAPSASPPSQPVLPTASDEDVSQKLLKVKRIYVESFGDDPVAKQVHAMVVASLTDSKKFIVTENKERADAILKGSGIEKTSQEIHAYDDSTSVAGAAGGHSGSVHGNWIDGSGHISGSSSGGFASRAAGISDSSVNTETINDARIAVRLVDKDGDVIWATTQESKGAKYKGASADVADKVVKELLRDVAKLARATSATAGTAK
jgi:curli biogenesis system outer membrane secretion channel CsgG